MKRHKNKPEKKEYLDGAIRKLIEDANTTSDPKERKSLLDLVEKLYDAENDRHKIELAEERLIFDKRKLTQEDIIKVIQIFGVPVCGMAMLIGYRILMETETPPDIFFRDIGKTTMSLFSFKKV